MNSSGVIRKRFIAGAVCTKCDSVDRIVVEFIAGPQGNPSEGPGTEGEQSRRRCVQCGFADEFAEVLATNFGGLPRGRPERLRKNPVNPVEILILENK